MNKPYSDSYLMTKSKKTLIEYLRVAEHNHMVCEETIDQQAKNFKELLKKERADAIHEFAKWLVNQGVLGDRVICDGEITDYGQLYAKRFKEHLKEIS